MSEEALAELIIERYARAKGLDLEDAKKKLKPVLKSEEKPDKLTEGLLRACDTLGRIKEVGEGAGDETRDMLSKLATAVVSRALSGGGSEGDAVDEGIGEASKYIAKIKMIDKAFGEEEAKKGELKELREYIDKALGEDAKRKELKEYIDGKIGALQASIEGLKELAGKGEGEEELPPEVLEKIEGLSGALESIKGDLEELKKTKEKLNAGEISKAEARESLDEAIERIGKAEEQAKGFLAKRGYRVASEGIPVTLEEAKKLVQEYGFEVKDTRISKEEVERMFAQERKKWQEEHDMALETRLEEKKIEAAENVVSKAIEQVMQPFQYFLKKWFEGSIEERVVSETPAPEGEA